MPAAALLSVTFSGLSLHWAFLIVFGVYTLIAALLAYLGYRKVLKVKAPERAIAQAKKTQATLIRR